MLKTIAAIALSSLMLLAGPAPAARPVLAAPAIATFNVNSTLDEADTNAGDGQCHSISNHCTLRAAVMEANFSSGAGAIILVPSGIYTLTIPASGGDGPDTGDLNLSLLPDTRSNMPTAGLTIALVGAGAARTIIDANQLDRVLAVGTNRVATVSGVTLRGGYINYDFGGGLLNAGTLTVTNSTISGNQAVSSYGGGGVANLGSLTLIQSTITGNSAAGNGGGLDNPGRLLVVGSTIDHNQAQAGGGIYNDALSNLTLVNSTLSDNAAVTDGGGILNIGEVDSYSTTIAGNWGDSHQDSVGLGGGVFNSNFGTFNMRNTLLTGNNLGNMPVWDDCYGTLRAYGTDIIALQGDPDLPTCTIDQPAGGNLYKLNSPDC